MENKSHVAGWPSGAPTPAQLKELFAQIASGRITKRNFQTLLRRGMSFENEEIVRQILGDDIIFPDEIAKARGLSYTDEQIEHFAETMPSAEELHWCKENNFAVVAGPTKPMGLLEVHSLKSELFYSKTGGWYAGEKFAGNDKAMPEWKKYRKEPIPNSTGKNWDEQCQLLSSEEEVPNAGEMSWFITTFFAVRKVRLFEKIYVRTSSLTADGSLVSLGYFDSSGLNVYHWDDDRDGRLGLAAARKKN